MDNSKKIVSPHLGEGIYLIKDVAKILRLDYAHVRRWINGYWTGALQFDCDYTFGEDGNKAINFLSLIEFYTFFKLRQKGLSTQELRELHQGLSIQCKHPYPFAIARDFYVDKGKKKNFVYYDFLQSLIKHDKKKQFSLSFVTDFIEKVEFDDNNIAKRFFPLEDSKNVVVDPKLQFGQPVITGTTIKTQAIYNLFKAGEPVSNICILYDICEEKALDAIKFHKNAA